MRIAWTRKSLVRTDASRIFLHSPPHQKKLKEKKRHGSW
jgi:hypothetical protein